MLFPNGYLAIMKLYCSPSCSFNSRVLAAARFGSWKSQLVDESARNPWNQREQYKARRTIDRSSSGKADVFKQRVHLWMIPLFRSRKDFFLCRRDALWIKIGVPRRVSVSPLSDLSPLVIPFRKLTLHFACILMDCQPFRQPWDIFIIYHSRWKIFYSLAAFV